MSRGEPLLDVENLQTQFETDQGTVEAVDGIDFTINGGETFGFVGESGAGKTVTGLSVMELIERPGRIVEGSIRYRGTDLRTLAQEEIRRIRGNEIAMVFQDPMTALNPAYTIGTQITDVVLEHTDMGKADAEEHAIQLLDDVGIPDPEARIDEYPHQFSGGMRQRALIAMALSCDPDLIIADEPTTALDVTIQAQILELLSELQSEYDLAIQLITHDMGIIAEMCDRLAVMYAGKIIEEGSVGEIFNSPRHPYTMGLMKAIPRLNDPRHRLETIEGDMPDLIDKPSGCSFRTRCPYEVEECAQTEPPLEPVSEIDGHTSACLRVDEIDFEKEKSIVPTETPGAKREIGQTLIDISSLRKYFTPESRTWVDWLLGRGDHVHAVDGVSITIRQGETVGLVGESGCGKTTLGRTITQLYEPDEGTVLYAGEDLTAMSRNQLREARSDLQVIFQDPFSSLNPRRNIKNIIGRPMEIHGLVEDDTEKEEKVAELLETVGLKRSHLNRYPHEFSGGQKQRIGIARALAVEPDFIVCDEPVSALDVSVQAKIINLLMQLQEEYGLTYLFIAHDLNVVQHIADKVAVMYLGEIVETGTVQEIFSPPYHPYTEVLLSSIPQPTPDSTSSRIVPKGEPPSPTNPPSGCRFHPRCKYAMPECKTDKPEDHEPHVGHLINCHLLDEELMESKERTLDQIVEEQRLMAPEE